MIHTNRTEPMPPVTKLNGFKYWKVGTRYSRAIVVNGEQIYADDYPVSLAVETSDFTEPDDLEFIRLMNRHK